MNYYNRFRDYYSDYVVQQGDTLYQIAKKNNTTVEEIMNLNNLTSTSIYPNQILFVPTSTKNNNNFKEYKTKENDTISLIIEKLNIPLETLLDLELVPNQKIKINGRSYLIRENDSLSDILNKNNISIEKLVELNRSNWIQPGSEIRIG